MKALIVFGIMFFFILLEVPLFLAVGLAGLIFILIFDPSSLVSVTYNMVNGLDNFALLAIPFYMLAGDTMNRGGLTKRIVGFAGSIFGYVRGGLNYVNISANIIMAGISGSAVADAAATGGVLIPAMEKAGYPKPFAAAITCASATMGPIIPPSVPMILFGLLSGAPIADLFLGGVVPGLMLAGILSAGCYIISLKRDFPKREGTMNGREIWLNFRRAFISLMLPVIVLGGIFSGAMTVTEAGAVAVMYALITGVFIYREISFREIPSLFYKTAYDAAILLIALATVQILSHLIAEMQLGEVLSKEILAITTNKYVILLLINLFLLIVGCVIDPITSLLLLVPILLPIIRVIGIDPVHFGVVMVLNLMIGLSTPPIGGLLFVTSLVAEVQIGAIVKEVTIFVLFFLIVLLLITFFPQLVLLLPSITS
ncbi:MAG: TRAP transporter large permease [Deltaproteobacteria bacterium]|nr:TRAP transporter large permease [Deltaproteobacteria bacterium]